MAAPAPPDATTQEAKEHFERGLELLKAEAWGPALAEFLRSRQLRPTRGNTLNAAIALRKLNRYDEALAMFEALSKEFPDSSPADRALVDRTIGEMEALIGTIQLRGGEPGATVSVDGRTRGTLPLAAPISVAAGPHVVRVYRQGFVPFEQQVDVAGRQHLSLPVQLESLGRSGTLAVTELHGVSADVLVDNVKVGTTPWEGSVAVGNHTVILHHDDASGTEPALATIRLNQVTPMTLVVVPLDAELSIHAEPLGSQVALDGVPIANGAWEGHVRGGPHSIEVSQEGFIPVRAQVQVVSGDRNNVVTYVLDRDLNSPMWAGLNPPKVAFEADVGAMIDPTGTALTGACSSCPVPVGLRAVAHASYLLRSGIGFGADLGFASLYSSTKGRSTGLAQGPDTTYNDATGTVSDTLSLRGFTVGASVSLHKGAVWPVLVRLGGGVLIGTVSDSRSGTFTPTPTMGAAGAAFYGSNSSSDSASYAFVAPEVRIGRRFGKHFELSLGAEAMVMFALHAPLWAGGNKSTESISAGGNLYYYPTTQTFSSTLVMVNPSLGARYEF